MDEAGFHLVMDILSGIQVFSHAACMAAFFYPFMAGGEGQGKSRLKKILMVFMVYMVMYFIGMSTPVYGWICMGAVIALLAAASGFLDMGREFTIFLGALFFCARKLSALIMRSILMLYVIPSTPFTTSITGFNLLTIIPFSWTKDSIA